MTMPEYLFWFSLVMSALNWLIFAGLTFLANGPAFRKLLAAILPAKPREGGAEGLDTAQIQAGFDPSKLASTVGSLAAAFGKSGATASAAAMSVFFALVAAIASGIAAIAD